MFLALFNVKNDSIHFTVTRSKKKVFESFGIKDCFVALGRNVRAECLGWLKSTQRTTNVPRGPSGSNEQNVQPSHLRRASIASSNLFVVNNTVREVGFDYLPQIPRSNQVNVGASTSRSNTTASKTTGNGNNDNDPFQIVPTNETIAFDNYDDVGFDQLVENER